MRAHQPGSTPIDIPESVPNPAHTPAPAPAPERAPTKVPDTVPEKVIAPASFHAFFSDQACDTAHAPCRSKCVLVDATRLPLGSKIVIR
jgi:hypothetical protein